MTIQELRIGNLVTYNSVIRIVEGVRLLGSHLKERISMVDLNYRYQDKQILELNKIEPIPLTDIWLGRLGFNIIKAPLNDDWFMADKEPLWIQKRPEEDFYYAYSEFDRDQSYQSAPIKFVHQLQNIYSALANKELHYTPPKE